MCESDEVGLLTRRGDGEQLVFAECVPQLLEQGDKGFDLPLALRIGNLLVVVAVATATVNIVLFSDGLDSPWILPVNIHAISSQPVDHNLDLFRPVLPGFRRPGTLREALIIAPSANCHSDLGVLVEVSAHFIDRDEEAVVFWRLFNHELVGREECENDMRNGRRQILRLRNDNMLAGQVHDAASVVSGRGGDDCGRSRESHGGPSEDPHIYGDRERVSKWREVRGQNPRGPKFQGCGKYQRKVLESR